MLASAEFDQTKAPLSAEKLAHVLFTFGLTWKEGWDSRTAFVEMVRHCVTACISGRA